MISVIIPYYNKPKTINRAIKSVISQTFTDWELIIIDDCSDISLIELEFTKDSRIRIFVNEQNLGPGPTRQRGLDMAKGEYVAFLDADDWWGDCFLLSSYEALVEDVNKKYAGTWCISQTRYKHETVLRRYSEMEHVNIRETILKYARPWQTGSILWRKECCGNWGNLSTNQDYFFEISSSEKCNQLLKINEVMYFVDQTQGNHRGDIVPGLKQCENTYQLFLHFSKQHKTSLNLKYRMMLFHRLIRSLLKVLEVQTDEKIRNNYWADIERIFWISKLFFRTPFMLKLSHKVMQHTSLRIYF